MNADDTKDKHVVERIVFHVDKYEQTKHFIRRCGYGPVEGTWKALRHIPPQFCRRYRKWKRRAK